VAGRVDVLDRVVAGVAVEVALAGALEVRAGVEEVVRVRGGPAAQRGQVVAGAEHDGAGARGVLGAGEAVVGATLVVGAPGERGGAVGVVGVAGDGLALVIEDEGGAAEAVADVVARVLVGEQRVGGVAGLAAHRGGDEQRELAGEAQGAVHAGPGPCDAAAAKQCECDDEERAQGGAGERLRGVAGLGELRGALGDALAVPQDPADELAVADLDLL
jgi:hypothetical protein